MLRSIRNLPTYIFIFLLGFGLLSCTTSENTTPNKRSMLIPLNSEIQAVLNSGLEFKVEVIVEGMGTYPLSNLTVDENKNTISGELSVKLPAGSHTLKLVYYVDDPAQGKVEILLTGITSVTVSPGGTSIADFKNVTSTSPDEDGDGYSNMIELQTNSNISDITSIPQVPPVADAGRDQNVITDAQVTLDSSGSYDPNGDVITYQWSIESRPENTTVNLSDEQTVKPTFTPSRDGTYIFALIVRDAGGSSEKDLISVNASTGNVAPVANAGNDKNVFVDAKVTLDGSNSSDANNDSLSYQWMLTSSPNSSNANLKGADTATPSITPNTVGEYIISLVVNDGEQDSDLDTVLINVTDKNIEPVANAGPDQNAETEAIVTLDGTGSSDPNSDALTYNWNVVSDTNTTLSDTTSANPTFTPTAESVYVFSLVVNDGNLNSTPDNVAVTVVLNKVPPVADAGSDQIVITGTQVTLDGSGSYDLNGDTITYQWTLSSFPNGNNASLTGADTTTPSITPDAVGEYIISLVVTDGELDSSPDTVLITSNAMDTGTIATLIPVPNVISAAALPQTCTSTMTVWMTIDAGNPQPMTLQDGNAAYNNNDISPGSHDFKIEFKCQSSPEVVLAGALITKTIVSGSNKLLVVDNDYLPLPDNDNDNIDNIQELELGTNPFIANIPISISLPSVMQEERGQVLHCNIT